LILAIINGAGGIVSPVLHNEISKVAEKVTWLNLNPQATRARIDHFDDGWIKAQMHFSAIQVGYVLNQDVGYSNLIGLQGE